MKTCPYCSCQIKEKDDLCPGCGRAYWDPDSPRIPKIEKIDSEAEDGCLSIIMLPLIVSLITAGFIILSGLILNLFIHFESNQLKIICLGISFLSGAAAYWIIKRYKNKKSS